MKKFAIALLALVVSMTLFTALPGLAADPAKWPEKTVELIWHSKVGSGGDLYLRALSRFLEKKFGTSVIVNNVTGASGANAWNKVRKSKPDGYTVLGVSSTVVASPVINKMPFNYESFDPVARMFIDAICIFVSADAPYKTLADLIADARKRPGEVTFAGGTAGNLEFIGARELMKAAGCEISIVPFEGGGQLVLDDLGRALGDEDAAQLLKHRIGIAALGHGGDVRLGGEFVEGGEDLQLSGLVSGKDLGVLSGEFFDFWDLPDAKFIKCLCSEHK